MPKPLLFLVALLFSLRVSAAQITIIESSVGTAWAKQDSVWRTVATTMGHTATIAPQSILANVANLSSSDVLIVSSATKGLSSAIYIQTIRQFVLSGRPLYIQSEYTKTIPGSMVFDSLMQAVGANFQWSTSTSGQLSPMNVTGSFASVPNTVPSLSFFNAGLSGEGSGVEKFLEFNGKFYGFYYQDPTGTFGTIITTSDQDWIWNNASPALMGNILFRLVSSITTRAHQPLPAENPIQIFPNPARNRVHLTGLPTTGTDLSLYSSQGKCIFSPQRIWSAQFAIDIQDLPAGIYTLFVAEKPFRFLKP